MCYFSCVTLFWKIVRNLTNNLHCKNPCHDSITERSCARAGNMKQTKRLRGWLHETGTNSDRYDFRSVSIQILVSVYMRPVRKITSDRFDSFRELNRHEWVRPVRQFFPCNRKLISDRSEIFVLSMRTKGVELSYRSEVIPVSCNHLLHSYRSHVMTPYRSWVRTGLSSYRSHVMTA